MTIYTVKLNNNFSGTCYGIVFSGGIGKTNDEMLAARLKAKGYDVTNEKAPAKKKGGR